MKYDAGADAYDLLTGRWSRMFAQTAIGKARINPGDRVLDVATGTGDTAVLACSAVGTSGYCLGLDVSVPMLRVAATKASTGPVGFLAASAMALPFPDGVFDAILCQFGLMFFPDRLQALAELRRLLRSNRRLVLTVWERPARAAFAGFAAEALSEQLPDLKQELLRPFSLSAPNEVRALLTTAGFNEVDVVHDARTAQFDSFEDYWKPYEQGGGRLGQAYLSLSLDAQATVRRQVSIRLKAFVVDGRITLPLEAFVGISSA
jgi:ubiquinone/menaquinone biosynthesis C-methylase UbiE